MVEDIIEPDDVAAVGERAVKREGLEAGGKGADVAGVVERLDMLARAGDGDAVEQFEEVEVEGVENGGGGALLRGKFGPGVEGTLGLAEDVVDIGLGAQAGIELVGISLVGEGELVAEVVEPVVDRGGREHEDLGLDPLTDHLVHQFLIAGFVIFVGVVVAEVVRLVDDDQVVVPPVDPVEGQAERHAGFALQIGVAEDVVIEPVGGEDVGGEIAFVGDPVVGEFFRTEYEDRAVAQFVVFDDGEGGEGFAQADAVGENAAVVGFELVDDAGGGIALEVEELLPDEGVLIAGEVVGEDIVTEIGQELVEDVVQHQEVETLGGVFLIDGEDVFAEAVGDVFDEFGIAPDLVEGGEINLCDRRHVEPVDNVRDGVAPLVAEVDGGEALEGEVDGGLGVRRVTLRGDAGELLHGGVAAVGAEGGLAAHPLGTFAGDGPLGEFVFELDFEFGAVEAAFAVGLGNMELAAFFLERVADLVGDEGGGGEEEFERFDRLQLGL